MGATLIYNRQIEIVIGSRLPLGRRLITRLATESGFTLWCTQLLSCNLAPPNPRPQKWVNSCMSTIMQWER